MTLDNFKKSSNGKQYWLNPTDFFQGVEISIDVDGLWCWFTYPWGLDAVNTYYKTGFISPELALEDYDNEITKFIKSLV